jgi:hypothetical protein
MEQRGNITNNPTREHIAQATQEIAEAEAKAENKAFPRRRYEEVRQHSDDILLAIEGIMLINKRERIGRDLITQIKGLFYEVNDVLDLISARDLDRQQPFYPEPNEFTARRASAILLNFEQKRLLDAGTGYEYADDSDKEEFFLVYEDEAPLSDYFSSQSKAS